MKKVYVFLADGFEEIEALTPVDALRRAGIAVETVSIMGRLGVAGSHGIVVSADKILDKKETVKDYLDGDMLFLPGGGKGTENLAADMQLAEIINAYSESGKYLAAICAAPSVFGRMGLLTGKKATCYPGFEKLMKDATCTGGFVEKDGNFITGKGMGVSLPFALKLIETLDSKEAADAIAAQVQMNI